MEFKPGTRWKSAVCDAEFVVVRGDEGVVEISCGGLRLIPHSTPRPDAPPLSSSPTAGSVAGRRYCDASSRFEVLCTRSGPGSLSVDGRELVPAGPKKLPSSD